MQLLETIEQIDLIKLDSFVRSTYGIPEFHSMYCEAYGFDINNGEMSSIEIPDESDTEWMEDYGPMYVKVVEVFRKLIADGHLPPRHEYNVHVWW